MQRTLFCWSMVVLLCAGSALATIEPVGHWSFDAGSGAMAVDDSGNGNDGSLNGSPTWVEGKFGSALQFDGSDDYVEIQPVIQDDWTIAFWMQTDQAGISDGGSWWQGSGLVDGEMPGVTHDFGVVLNGDIIIFGVGQPDTHLRGTVTMSDGEWHHVTATRQADDGAMALYIDGVVDVSMTGPTGTKDAPATLRFGSLQTNLRFYTGLMDDVWMFDRVIEEEEMLSIIAGKGPELLAAAAPEPADGSKLASQVVVLSWRPGDKAATSAVYFGTDADAVAQATPESDLFVTETHDTTVAIADALIPGTTYYWRVDSLNPDEADAPWMGKVWSFFVVPETAYDPVPADGTEYVLSGQLLEWQPGLGALLHTVYVGTDRDTVASATTGGLFQVSTSYPAPDGDPGQTFYWRVDEFNPPNTVKGEVWSYTLVPEISVEDESLVGWWNMDQSGAGSIIDASGHGNHGLIRGQVDWVPGVIGSAIELNADDLITVAPLGVTTDTATMTAWVRPDQVHGRTGLIFMRKGQSTCGFNLMGQNQLGYHWQDASETWQYESGLNLMAGEWAFVAMVVTPESATFYMDNTSLLRSISNTHAAVTFNGDLTLGSDTHGGGRRFVGAMDDARFYTRALTVEEMDALIGLATVPPLVEDEMMVDSFDRYNAYQDEDGEDVWNVWFDGFGGNGSGSLAGNAIEPHMERNLVAGGLGQALPLVFDNSGVFVDMDGKPATRSVSEVIRSFDPAQDLTRNGATHLEVSVRGFVENFPGLSDGLYLAVKDGAGASATALLLDSEALTKDSWQKAQVVLSGLAGVDLTQIVEVTLGVGNPTTPQVGGSGTVILDNLMLTTD